MKKFLTIFLLLLSCMNFSYAQQEVQKATVMHPVYFDISPPLRDMVQKSDATVDLSWKDGIVKNMLNTYTNDNSTSDQLVNDPVLQFAPGFIATDTTIQNFDGIGATGFYPPDTDGDVGLSHYLQVVNCKYAIYDKNGNKIFGPVNNSSVFSGMPNNSNDGDAIVLYDEVADRWLFSQFSLPNYPNGPFFEMVAISQTNDPTGSWYRYQYQFSNMPDYPKLAVWVDGYYMTIRRFAMPNVTWIGPAAVAMDRAKMLVGDPTATMQMFELPSSSEGTQAADCDSDFPPMGTPCPVAYLTTTTVKLYDFHVDWTTPANSTFVNNQTIPISMFSPISGNQTVTQKGTTQKLDPMSGKRIMFRMPFRTYSSHWSMLLNTTVNVSGTAGIRWMELRNNTAGTWSLYQEGTFAPGDGHHRWMGSIAMDSAGNIALGYSISSSTLYPSIRYTGRMNGDPLGTMTIAEKGIVNGGGSQTGTYRWGDYSAMNADPAENGKFWYTQEYYGTTSGSNWKTRVGSFSFTNTFATVTTAFPNPVCIGDSTQLSVTATGGSGSYTFSWSSIPAGFSSTLQSPKAAPTDTTKYIAVTSDGTLTRSDTVQVNTAYKPTANAGEDVIVCWYVTSVPLLGVVTNYKQFGWSTTGSGSFSDPYALETNYLPTLNDKIAGFVNIKLVALSNSPCSGNVVDTVKITFDACTGIPVQNSQETGLSIRPNPAHGTVSITLNGTSTPPAVLTITSTDGKILFSETVEAANATFVKQLDISGYAKGIYVVQLKTGKKVITEKMIVQ